MLLKKIFCLLFTLFVTGAGQLFSQNSAGGLINQVRILYTREISNTLNYNDIEGTPYYSDGFIEGTVYLKNGDFATVPLRYDIFRDEIEFLKDNKIYWVTKKDIKFVRYGPDMMIPSYSVADTSKLDYFFLLETGNYNLLNKLRVNYYPLVPPKGYSQTVPARFKRESDEFYLQKEGSPAQRIKSNKDLKLYFAGNTGALEFIRKERIKTGRADSLRKLAAFLNN